MSTVQPWFVIPAQPRSLLATPKHSMDPSKTGLASSDNLHNPVLTVCISDVSYQPSDISNGEMPVRIKPQREPFVWDNIITQARTEMDPTAKSLMLRNQMAYLCARASPYEWQEILNDLSIFEPGEWLSEKVVCRPLMDSWWSRRHEAQTKCTYLPFSILHEMSMAIRNGGADDSTHVHGLVGGRFYNQYGSIIPHLTHRRVGFVLIRNISSLCGITNTGVGYGQQKANHFFAVVFDYDSQRAYSFGAHGGGRDVNVQIAEESKWDTWYGPDLWREIAYNLGWEDSIHSTGMVHVISKEWEQAGIHHTIYGAPSNQPKPRMGTTVGYTPSRSFQGSLKG